MENYLEPTVVTVHISAVLVHLYGCCAQPQDQPSGSCLGCSFGHIFSSFVAMQVCWNEPCTSQKNLFQVSEECQARFWTGCCSVMCPWFVAGFAGGRARLSVWSRHLITPVWATLLHQDQKMDPVLLSGVDLRLRDCSMSSPPFEVAG